MKIEDLISKKDIIIVTKKEQIPILFSIFRELGLRLFGGKKYSKMKEKDESFYMRGSEFLAFNPINGIVAKESVFKSSQHVSCNAFIKRYKRQKEIDNSLLN